MSFLIKDELVLDLNQLDVGWKKQIPNQGVLPHPNPQNSLFRIRQSSFWLNSWTVEKYCFYGWDQNPVMETTWPTLRLQKNRGTVI